MMTANRRKLIDMIREGAAPDLDDLNELVLAIRDGDLVHVDDMHDDIDDRLSRLKLCVSDAALCRVGYVYSTSAGEWSVSQVNGVWTYQHDDAEPGCDPRLHGTAEHLRYALELCDDMAAEMEDA